MKKRFTDEQVVRILREAETKEIPIRDLCKRHNITEQTFFRWRNQFGGMDVADTRKLKDLESENAKLKRLVAEQLLVIVCLMEFSRKKWPPRRVGAMRSISWPAGGFCNARPATIRAIAGVLSATSWYNRTRTR